MATRFGFAAVWRAENAVNLDMAATGPHRRSDFSPRLRRGVALRGTTPTGMAADPPAEPGASRDLFALVLNAANKIAGDGEGGAEGRAARWAENEGRHAGAGVEEFDC
jgi:hypothetical protein